MRIAIVAIFTLIQVLAAGQGFDKKNEVEKIFSTLRAQNVIIGTIANTPVWITSFQFEGDYSRKKVFPDAPLGMIICASPITFTSSIHETLKTIDSVYDSTFYQKQIQSAVFSPWHSHDLKFTAKIRFIRSRLFSKLKSEIGMISYPLFSKDGKTVVITYGTINGNSVIKQMQKVYVLKKNDNEWITAATVDSIKTW